MNPNKQLVTLILSAAMLATPLAACQQNRDSHTATSAVNGNTAANAAQIANMTRGYQLAKWGSNVSVAYVDGQLHYRANGLPNHPRPAEYALPNEGVMRPTAATSHAGADISKAQNYEFKIPLNPRRAVSPTTTSLGVVGAMISGAPLFNPYEFDQTTVVMQSNFSVKNAAGADVWFLDDCAGHPTPFGEYHYHALPKCVVAQVDGPTGPSHILGIALDGYPIYGDRDMNGKKIQTSQLDQCNGITSPTPEFPQGIYHYVLLDVPDSTSSIRCFTGVIEPWLVQMPGMPGMPPKQ
ncbi:MAG: YHYH protein [Anaerolineae bacterium]|nr:YHYH protein [Anaerolineae bacterium]